MSRPPRRWNFRRSQDIALGETTPHHLTLEAPDATSGSARAQMNLRCAMPAQGAIWRASRKELSMCSAPTMPRIQREEKAKPYPASPSGMPGVQRCFRHARSCQCRADVAHALCDLTAPAPRGFRLCCKGRIAAGYDADFTIVDLNAARPSAMLDRVARGWTPYDGMRVTGGRSARS